MSADRTADDHPSVLITGGTGFLGLHLCEHFFDRGWDVTAFDIKPFKSGDDMDHIDFVEGDIRDQRTLSRALDGVDHVVHAAAALALWDDQTIREVTVQGTETVLEAADTVGVDRLVFLSSIVVYGQPATLPITEDAPLTPIGTYGNAKVEAERHCRDYRDRLCIPILRPTSFIGPRRLGIFSVLFDWIEDGANVPLIGSGENRYQLLHVADLVDAIDLVLTVPRSTANETYNVGTDEFRTMREDFQAPIDHAGTGKRTVGLPLRPTVWSLRLLDRINLSPIYPWIYETAGQDYYLSIERLKSIGWEPAYSNQAALVETYKWYLEHLRSGRTDTVGDTDFDHRIGWEQGALTLVKRLFQTF